MTSFTLAEVLIVLGILGLIADMTIPTLHQNIKEKVTVTTLKNTYTIFQEAFKMSEANIGPIDTWGAGNLESIVDSGEISYDTPGNTASSKILMDIFVKNIKVLKYCESNDKSCFSQKKEGMKFYSAILANGTSFFVYSESGTCKKNWGNTQMLQNVCAILMVDIDGPNKGKGEDGKEIFGFFISKYGLVPFGSTLESFRSCYAKDKGSYCAAWVIYNENMDYLHCNDLSWDGKKSCK